MKYDVNKLKIIDCHNCDISLTRRSIVNGRGPLNSKVVIVGEAPGGLEDKTGIPFVGNAGQFLREVLRSLLINPKDIYITNIVKCRPTYNRTPTPTEIHNCLPYFFVELIKLKPKLVLLLGTTPNKVFYNTPMFTMTKYRGKLGIINNMVILSTYHPSYVIRNKNNDKLVNQFIKDIKLFKELVKLVN